MNNSINNDLQQHNCQSQQNNENNLSLSENMYYNLINSSNDKNKLLTSLKLKKIDYEEIKDINEGHLKENFSKQVMLTTGAIFAFICAPAIKYLEGITIDFSIIYFLILIGFLATFMYIIFKGIEICFQNIYRKKISQYDKYIKIIDLAIKEINSNLQQE